MDDNTKDDSWNKGTALPPGKFGASVPKGSNGSSMAAKSDDDTVVAKARFTLERKLSGAELLGTVWADRYELLQVLGRGGMGTVYKSRNRVNGQIRAVKILNSDLTDDSDALRRFQQEAKAAARITHPHAIQVIDDGIGGDGSPFLVMEFAEGVSLSDVIKKEKRLPILTGLRIFQQICLALEIAHTNGVIHRDIKPSNILIIDTPNEPYYVKVLDFGIAKVLPRNEDGTVAVTATGAVIGSPPYMSPEQCLGEHLDHRSDLYSLGCLMYEVLSGSPPLVGDNQMSTMYKQINELAPPLKNLNEDIRLVQEVDRIISKCLAKSPERRYLSAESLERELEESLTKAQRRSSIFALVGLQLRTLVQGILNRLGSSKRAVVLVFFVIALTALPFSYFAAPYVFVKVPKVDLQDFAWQHSPMWSTASYQLQHKFDTTERALLTQLKDPDVRYAEQAAAYRQLGDMYFDNGSYQLAAVRYNELAMIASKRFQSKTVDRGELDALKHEIATAQCRYARCLIHLRSYKTALDVATMGRALSLYDNFGDGRYQIYFAQTIGVATVMLTKRSTALTNDYFDNFIGFIQQKGYVPERASEIAQSFAEIGDCYFETGQWDRAISAYRKARSLWGDLVSPAAYNRSTTGPKGDVEWSNASWTSQLVRVEDEVRAKVFARHGDFAAYNAASASMKIGVAQRNLGSFDEAKKSIESAQIGFETWGGEKNIDRTRALLVLADLDWRMHDYFGSWMTRAQALRLLRQAGGR